MRFFIYARKSTDDEGRQVLSIDSQLDELREYARKESLTVVREYIEAQTAKEPGRPVFNAMMEAIEAGEVGGLLAWHPDRISRNGVDAGRLLHDLDKQKPSPISPLDAATIAEIETGGEGGIGCGVSRRLGPYGPSRYA